MTIASVDQSHLTQRQLESTLLAAANSLRGPVDPGDFKAYVFPVFFFKWISDNWDYEHAQAIDEIGDDITDEEEADYHAFVIPQGCHWKDVHETVVNLGSKLGATLQRLQQANPDSLAGVFGDVNWGNTDRLPESALAALLDVFHSLTLNPASVSGDMLGSAYEYLLREFAEASGKKAGEFFTPRHVVHLLVRILDPQPGDTVADPACGSAGMLVETVNAVKLAGGDPRTLKLHGQEVNLTTSAIAKMNLYLHGLEGFKVVRGDTFREPKLLDGDALQKFDVVIANPPFSLQNWGADTWTKDPYGRAFCDVPPKGNGDFAWIQHMLATMKDQSGRVGVVMSHGVLFRGGREGAIRECIIGQDQLEAVIGLPNNLFYSTSIPVCLLIFRSRKPERRKDHVLFIDAKNRFRPAVNQNIMSDEDIALVADAYRDGVGNDDECSVNLRLVHHDEIRENGYDLNISRYLRGGTLAEANVEEALITLREAQERLVTAQNVLDAKLKGAGFSA